MIATRALFCDDIREEQGNKKSFMGVYGEHLVVKEYPCLLPTFCMNVWIAFHERSELESICLTLDALGEVSEFPIDEAMLSTVREEFSRDAAVGACDACVEKPQLVLNLVLSPLIVKAEGHITVTVTVPSGRYQAGCLKVVSDIPLISAS